MAARSLLKPLIGTPNHECYIRIEHMTTDMKSLQAGNCICYGVRYSRSADVRRRTTELFEPYGFGGLDVYLGAISF